MRARAASFCHTVDLRVDRFGAEVRVEAAAARGQEIRRDGAREVGIFLAEFIGRGFDAVDEFLAGGPQVRSARGSGVVTVAGRGGAGLKVFGLGEILPDKRRPDDLSTFIYKAAVGLLGKQHLTQAGDHAGINQPS